MDIPKHKITVNHEQTPSLIPVEINEIFRTMKHDKNTPKTKENLMTTREPKNDKEINANDQKSTQTEFSEKELEKSSDKLNKKIPLKIIKRVDTTNNTSVPSVK